MLQRCENPKNQKYGDYGGRGIKVCRRWLKFENFLADMGECPPGLTIERKDNDKGYFPGNCIWASRAQQAKNRRYCRRITFNGKTQLLDAWAEETGIASMTLRGRLNAGWSVKQALTVPPGTENKAAKFLEHDGLRLNIRQWARRLGVSPTMIKARIKKGMAIADVLSCPSGSLDRRYSRKNNIILTHQGETLSLKDWAEKLQVAYLTLYMRHQRGWPIEQILGVSSRNSTSRCSPTNAELPDE